MGFVCGISWVQKIDNGPVTFARTASARRNIAISCEIVYASYIDLQVPVVTDIPFRSSTRPFFCDCSRVICRVYQIPCSCRKWE